MIPPPPHVKRVIETWKKQAPNYRINKIDETNCNVNANAFVREAYKQKKWAFVADYCRFAALEKEGGLYLDTDHILKDNPDKVLKGADRVFTFEHRASISASFIAVKAHDPVIREINQFYETEIFDKERAQTRNSPYVVRTVLKKHFPTIMNQLSFEKDSTRVLPTNVAMIDFGGGENIAEHLYDNLTGEGDDKYGYYYNRYKMFFLYESTIPLCDNGEDFFITYNNSGYSYNTKKWADIISINLGQLMLHWRDEKSPRVYEKRGLCFSSILN